MQKCGMGKRTLATTAWLAALPVGAMAQYSTTLLQPSDYVATYAGGNGAVQVGSGSKTGASLHPLMWTGTAGSVVDLLPGFFWSWGAASGASGGHQVGYAWTSGTNSNAHALVWHSTPANPVDLTPAGFSSTFGFGIDGNSVVGAGTGNPTQGLEHALLWRNLTAASYVDLNPAGFYWSDAFAVSGDTQVGYGYKVSDYPNPHAFVTHGSAQSAVELTPAGMTQSEATGVSGDTEVGYCLGPSTNRARHAYLWHGTAASGVDLDPTGQFFASDATAIAGKYVVGYGINGATPHALLFRGGAGVIDLNNYMTGLTFDGQPLTLVQSRAFGVDSMGNVIGEGMDANNRSFALIWRAVPEPGPFAGLACGALILAAKHRRPLR